MSAAGDLTYAVATHIAFVDLCQKRCANARNNGRQRSNAFFMGDFARQRSRNGVGVHQRCTPTAVAIVRGILHTGHVPQVVITVYPGCRVTSFARQR